MLLSYLNITVIAEWCAFIAAMVLLDKPTGNWRFFKPVILLTIILDAAGWGIAYFFKTKNAPPYNIILLINTLFFIWIFSLQMQPVKNLVYLLLSFFTSAWLFNFFFYQGIYTYNSYTELLSNIILAFLSCYMLYTLLTQENYVSLTASEYFWLSLGVLFSALGSMLLYLFLDILQAYNDKTGINVYGYINYTLNVILYGSLIIAFVCRKKSTRRILLSLL